MKELNYGMGPQNIDELRSGMAPKKDPNRIVRITPGPGHWHDCDLCCNTRSDLFPGLGREIESAVYAIWEDDKIIGFLCDFHARQWDDMDSEEQRRAEQTREDAKAFMIGFNLGR